MDYLTGPLLAFLGVSALVIMTPGPDTTITIRNTLTGGRAGGLATALGIATGQAIWALATSAGIVALLVASEPLFQAVKYAGAARPLTPGGAFSQGLVSDLSNPKMAAFFTSLLPQFVPPDTASFVGLILLGLLFSLLTLFWLVSYTLAIARVGKVLRRPAIRRALEGITGAALVGLGLKLATENR
jgi:threonine/homoserine/homoserine lactone efflux protein